jgi:ankyrin repeat protein
MALFDYFKTTIGLGLTEDEKKHIQLLKKINSIFNLNFSSFKQQNQHGENPLMFILGYNQKENLNLSQEQIMHVIEKSDLTIQNKDGWTPLMYVFTCNQSENLNLTTEQIMQVIEKSDLTIQDKDGYNPLMLILQNNGYSDLTVEK